MGAMGGVGTGFEGGRGSQRRAQVLHAARRADVVCPALGLVLGVGGARQRPASACARGRGANTSVPAMTRRDSRLADASPVASARGRGAYLSVTVASWLSRKRSLSSMAARNPFHGSSRSAPSPPPTVALMFVSPASSSDTSSVARKLPAAHANAKSSSDVVTCCCARMAWRCPPCMVACTLAVALSQAAAAPHPRVTFKNK